MVEELDFCSDDPARPPMTQLRGDVYTGGSGVESVAL